jgi:APA family basic amino acid/polyamine antiporter
MGSVMVITTVIKFMVLAFMSTVGLLFIWTANFTPWNVSGQRTIAAIGGGMALALFSYLGLESASVAAARSLTVVFGVVPNSELAEGTAPFSEAVNAMFGGTSAGSLIAIAVIISGFGALNGSTMLSAEMPLAAAKDGLFPPQFKRPRRGARLSASSPP